eukprot:358855-Chlamydomonas_euryale.AAC.7
MTVCVGGGRVSGCSVEEGGGHVMWGVTSAHPQKPCTQPCRLVKIGVATPLRRQRICRHGRTRPGCRRGQHTVGSCRKQQTVGCCRKQYTVGYCREQETACLQAHPLDSMGASTEHACTHARTHACRQADGVAVR